MNRRLQSADIDPGILGEAADWLVLLQSGEAAEADHERLARWRHSSAAHEAAWQRAEAMLATFRSVPSQLARQTLQRSRTARRQLLRSLLLVGVATPAAWYAWQHMPWREWRADLRTATGEQHHTTLPDGTQIVLNTGTAIDVLYTPAERRLHLLRGELLVTTAPDIAPLARPFVVQVKQGSLRPLGTRFAVRQLEDQARLVVTKGAVEVWPARGVRQLVRAGEQLHFTQHAADAPVPADNAATLWERGMLVARDLPVDALVAELARYHRGVLRCDPALAGLSVSGAFPVNDVPASLALLEKTLPLRVHRASPFWVTLRPR